ncbi:hypothetical protein SAMN05216388_100942 [Halorientalis persicus]|uniref:Nucleoside 2-deoxyribosyltransferase n=1 Tax=Halorientalis persicus TaxID=1367881 RepID=A0A1H8ML88_9EURY|nr:hypothetical protein [Halorientalis persicus]SEO18201.1 hypothetical protein SAMN05216388_100942 [Halorientalis persicus]
MTDTNQPSPRIYTAGAMREDGEHAEWRRSVQGQFDDITFYHPEGFSHEHSGFRVGGAVSEDIAAIRAADGLVAYITETPQVGTTTEVLHAVHTGTPTLVLFNYDTDESGLIDGKISSDDDDYEFQELRYPTEVDPIQVRGHATDHWFLVNYLVGDSKPQSTQPGEVEGHLPGEIQRWPGVREATVMAIPDEEDLQRAVYNWIESEFGVDAASSLN